MTPARLITLLAIAALVAVGSIALMVLNVIMLVAHANAATKNPDLKTVSKTPWILSLVACLVGPFALVLAPMALVMSLLQLHKMRKQQRGAEYYRFALLGLGNATFLVLAIVLFTAWTLWLSFVPP